MTSIFVQSRLLVLLFLVQIPSLSRTKTQLPELMLSFRKQVEDALYFFEEFADIDPSIEENIDPLNTAAADFLQVIMEELDMLLSRHFILTLPQNNQFTSLTCFCLKTVMKQFSCFVKL